MEKLLCVACVLAVLVPCSADKNSFDCKMRQLAMDYANKIQPVDGQSQKLADALNGAVEAQHCNVSARVPAKTSSPSPPSFPVPKSVAMYYVDANNGSDAANNSGASIDSPFKTISRALTEARSSEPIVLDDRDSYVTIQNYGSEEAVISGGKVIEPKWEEFNTDNSMNIYKADLSSAGVESVMGLRVNGTRAIRARYPNANPEIDGFGSSLKAKKWLPSTVPPNPDKEVNPDTPFRNSSDSFQKYQLGINGSCVNFDPPAGYWCGSKTSGGGAFTYRSPSGLIADKSILPHQPYKNATGAVIQAWRPGHWASWMFEVGDYDAGSGTFKFSKGGFQGARGNDNGDEFFIENVMEELDAPGEWYFDESTKMLYFFYNATSKTPPPAGTTFVVPVLKTLISIKATQKNPAKEISIKGITFRDTAYTYMDPHGMPSGGDWGLQRSGALFLEGTVDSVVQGCVFERLDGNAVMISGFNRGASISHNEFAWIGDSAIASWGDTTGSGVDGMGWDGTAGNQPRFNKITYNFAHELGIFEKQSSFYFQAKSCQSTISNNIFFNGPRAGINFNDGFGGGNNVSQNLILNTCRESGDHGPFNSWDRQVYVTKVKTGSPSPDKEWDHIFQNFMIANYNSQEAIDNDDGSAYYKTHDNFFAYSGNGMKNDFGGHDNHHYNNIYAYVGRGFGICKQLKGHEDYFYNNTLVMTKDGDYGSGQQCSGDGMTVVHDNKVYTPTGKVTECGSSLADWQAKGNDPGTTASTFPSDDDLIKMIKQLLNI